MWFRRFRGSRIGSLCLATLLAFQACDSVAPSREPQLNPNPTPSSEPSPITAAKIVIGVHVGGENVGVLPGFQPSEMPLFPALPNGGWWDQVVRRLIYSGVYRLNDAGVPVEDLAVAPCTWTEDRLTITCRLRDAQFHDGVPLTADDVAFTFELLGSGECRTDEDPAHCIANLASADAPDAHTVVFRLDRPDPTFLTLALPDVMIESRARIEASYARFRAGSRGRKPADLEARAKRITDAIDFEHPDCASLVADGETAVRALGLEPWSRAEFDLGQTEAVNSCSYASSLARVLREAARSLSLEGMDAILAAYRILDYHNELPIGSGPWKVAEIDPGSRMGLEAFDAYHRGPPATSAMEVRLVRTKQDAIRAVRERSVDWLLQPFSSQDPFFLRDGLGGNEDGLTFSLYDTPTWFGMLYNLRPGALFADSRLRQAVELCIDKEETVAAATRGQFLPIQSPIVPSSWAYEPALNAPTRDVDRANALIVEAGWSRGPDDIYVKGGTRLSAVVPIRRTRADRVKFLRLVEDQVKDCGMEISPLFTDDLDTVLYWPQLVPGTRRPWDVAFNGWIDTGGPEDPAMDDTIFDSRHITSATNRDDNNMMGYKNPTVDRLLDGARKTYVLEQRAKFYRQYQTILANERPMLFAYAVRVVEARSDRLTSTEGPLSASSRTWWWQLDDLVKHEPVS
jgi:ABC-type transport system substrate-binding protein